jgi:predicted aspartyl protease
MTATLHLSAGTLRLRNVRWLVSENDMDEVLLGRPLLKTLGLDASTHLAAVRDNFHDLDCSKIASPLT